MPTQGNSLTLSCLIQDVVNDNSITWFVPKSIIGTANCYRLSGFCTGSTPGYTYTVNQSGAYLDITSINRYQDEGTWKCSYRGSDGLDTVRAINITVYTLPSQLIYTIDVQAPMDLSTSNLTLQCKTSSCTNPVPFIKWYYKIQTSPIISGVYSVGISITSSDGSCSSQEKLYTSTLQIPMYTTWSDNSDKNVTFYCRTEYPDPSRNIQSTDSGTVRFAVAVTSVILSIYASEVVFYEGYPQMMTCISSPSRPISTIRWFLGSSPLTNNITTTNTIDNTGLYILTSQIFLTLMRNASNQQIKCEGFIGGQQAVTSMEKPSVNVWYKPSKPLIREYGAVNSGFPWLENMTRTLQCYSSDYGNPGANLTWLTDRGVMDTMNNLVIIGLMPSDDNRKISCKLFNRFTSDKNIDVLSDPVMLNIEYYPIILYNASVHLLVNETQSLSVLCVAKGNPKPQLIQWKNQPNSIALRLDNISRIHKGTYTCEATAFSSKYGTITSQKQLDIIVQYAPDVKVTLNGSKQQNETAILICEAQGIPAQYTFYTWIQMWEDTVVRTGLQGATSASQNTITIDSLSLESMGTYICTANNGITGINGTINQTGSGSLNITGIPNILVNSTLFFGELGMSVSITIPLYSNPVIESIVFQRNGTEIINSSRTLTLLTWEIVNYAFYGSMVKLKAQKAHLIIQNLTHGDFVNYILELRNSIGKTFFRFKLDAFEPNVYKSPESSVAGIAGGISAGIVIILGLIIGMFIWRRNLCMNKCEHVTDKDIKQEQEVRKNQTSSSPLKEDVASGNEYEGLHFTDTEVNQYLELNVMTTENTENSDKRSPESDSYEKLHPYANNDIQMYSTLKIPAKDSQKVYENAG
ncbi:hypothetical protein CHS0354_016693 [Potamilus streckersoni]|nr:hypothetical protein CHS0354_016693 [Potamilus streckersoni]